MDTVLQDIRYALRMLWKHRFATFVCAGALALGWGPTPPSSAWRKRSCCIPFRWMRFNRTRSGGGFKTAPKY